MSWGIRPLTDSIGVEVSDVDVRTLTAEDFTVLRDLWREHLVLVFRGQELSADEQATFAEGLGPLFLLGEFAANPGVSGGNSFYISNQVVDGKPGALPDGEMWFHFDLLYSELPPSAGILFALEVPPEGGNTIFTNAIEAFARLTPEVKEQVLGLTAEHVYDYRTTTRRISASEAALSHRHPAVVRHPVIGKPVLYVSRLMTIRLLELGEKESDELLQLLFAQTEKPEFHYEHKWRPGDLVVWDNNSGLHSRTDFDPKYRRTLRRMSLANAAPPEAFRRHAVLSGSSV
jgi:taurine dioxygenase